MLIYIHVPFCKQKCRYCAFHSEKILSEQNIFEASGIDRMQLWLDSLMLEIALWSDRLGKKEVKSVFFGGGTPSLLEPKAVEAILNRIHKAFPVQKGAEITLEANPESMQSLNKAKDYAKLGINRISLGVQSLNDAMLEKIGRIHTADEARKAYKIIRQAHIHNVSLDLMWGLPKQTTSIWYASLDEAISWRAEHLSCYGLSLEENTLMFDDYEAGQIKLPKEKELANMYIYGSQMLEEEGYIQYEISNYARMGYHSRHNLGYWEGEEYLGLGPSASSTLSGRRWSNSNDLLVWSEDIKSGSSASSFANIEILSPQNRVLELIMLRLRTSRGLRVKAYQEITGRDFMADNKLLIQALHKKGLIKISQGYLRLTTNGFLVSNSIIRHLFDNTKLMLEK